MTISSVGSSTSLTQLRQLQQSTFKTADVDGDGQLSTTEFESIGQNVQGSGKGDAAAPMRSSGGLSESFGGDMLSALLSTQSVDDVTSSVMSSVDTDGDGALTTEEISSALSANAPEGVEGQDFEDQMATEIVSALDSDGDGSLSSSEISTALSGASEGSSSQSIMGALSGGGSGGGYDSLDTNKDGVVSAEELAAANGSESTESTESTGDLADLFKTADQDGDGSLSEDEFLTALQGGESSQTSSLATSLANLVSGSTATSELMQKLLSQLEDAMTSSSSSQSSGGVSVTA